MANTKKDPCPKGKVPDGKGGCRDLTMKERMEKTNKRDKEFYDEMGPVPEGFTRAKFKPSFSEELLKGEWMKNGGSTNKKMAMGGTKKPLKPAMYGTAMKPTMMAKPSMMKKGGTKMKMVSKGSKVATKKYLTGGPTGANGDGVGSGSGPKQPKEPKEDKGYVKAKSIKTAKYGTAMMKKGGIKKK